MNLLADENVHRLISDRLAADRHDVSHIGELAPSITDAEVLAIAVARGALLITNDLDFGELVYTGARGGCLVVVVSVPGRSYGLQASPYDHPPAAWT